jgi:predicted TIM-barrel fold metal-dependent hydrolase
MTKQFVFSGDGHVREPHDLYVNALPESLRVHAIQTRREDDMILLLAGDRVLLRTRVGGTRAEDEKKGGITRQNVRGASDLALRLEDLAMEGIDAEILFPTTAMFAFLVEHPEAELASAQAYNDWLQSYLAGNYHRFVRCGILPVRDAGNAVAELERLAKLGFTSVMLPSSIPPGVAMYNDPWWDPIFDAAQRLGMVFCLHTATGRADVRVEKGPGGAVINYTDQMRDAIHSVMYLVAGGLLDRFPGVHVCVVESGASWLAGLAERMDETYEAHFNFVKPKLSAKPSEVIRRQVHATFQYDRACIMSRSVIGHRALIWGSDYPHAEGTFPHSREVVAGLFDGIDITESEKADIIGLNAARLFRLEHPALTGIV